MSFIKKQLLFILLSTIAFANCSYCQDTTDYLVDVFPKQYGQKPWRFLLGFDAKRSFYAGYPVKFNGLRIGAEYKGVHRFGIGVYGLKKNVVFTEIDVNQPGATDTSVVKFHVSYSSLFYERVFYKTPKWEVALPFYLSGGTVEGIYQDSTGLFHEFANKPFSAFSGGAQVKYYIWPWLAPKVSVGYRITFNTDPEIKQAFNSPYYALGISISIFELYKTIFKYDSPRKQIRSEIEKGEVQD